MDYQVLQGGPIGAIYCMDCSFSGIGNNTGTMTYLQNVSLMNNWKVERVDFDCDYHQPFTGEEVPFLGTPVPNMNPYNTVDCKWPAYGAALVGGTLPKAGDVQIKGISVEWKTTTNSLFDFVYYGASVIVKGPKGTKPY